MRRLLSLISAAWMISGAANLAQAHSGYVGYSGAPGAHGTCASSCHGSGGGTIQVNGFPDEYVPGQAYTVSVSHNGGSTIVQFNSSCRLGAGSDNAGVISAGTSTAIYNTNGETNGVHFSSAYLDGGTFVWTAPAAGTGDVRLYLAGLQGSVGGANNALVLLSTEQVSSAPGAPARPGDGLAFSCAPTPFGDTTTLRYTLPDAGTVRLEIFDPSGRCVFSQLREQAAGPQHLAWPPAAGGEGVYLARITTAHGSEVIKALRLP